MDTNIYIFYIRGQSLCIQVPRGGDISFALCLLARAIIENDYGKNLYVALNPSAETNTLTNLKRFMDNGKIKVECKYNSRLMEK